MDANRKQAMVPEGARRLTRSGPRRGSSCRPARAVVIVLPGPPRELQPMWPAAMETQRGAGRCSAGRRRCTATRCGCSAIPESEIAKSLREIEATMGWISRRSRSPPVCGAARSRSTSATATRRRRSRERSAPGLPSATRAKLFSLDGETIDSQVAELLAGHRLGLAESCSGGLLAARITDRAGASDYLAGGVVAYSNRAKVELLGVDAGLIEEKGAVSPEVAEAMAKGALERFGADRRGLDHRDRRAGRGHRGKAGRLRLLQRAPRRRHRDRPPAGHPRRPRRHPRTLRAGRHAPAADPARGRRGAPLEIWIRSPGAVASIAVSRVECPAQPLACGNYGDRSEDQLEGCLGEGRQGKGCGP